MYDSHGDLQALILETAHNCLQVLMIVLRIMFSVHWKEPVTNEELYGAMMRVIYEIQERRMRFPGHTIRQAGTQLSNLIL